MKKLTVISALLFALYLPNLVNAQQTIGFSDSTDFQHIIDYRLPDWGYSNFYLMTGTIQTSGDFYMIDIDDNERYPNVTENTHSNNSRANVNVRPAYNYYRESEHKTISLNTNLAVQAGIQDINRNTKRKNIFSGRTDTLSSERNGTSSSYGSDYQIDYDIRHFVHGDFFLLTGLNANLRYQFSHNSNEQSREPPQNVSKSKNQTISRRLDAQPEAGIGFGRLRNIAPQLRAIRLNERYKTLGKESLSDNEIKTSAEQFTKIQGYQRTNDRYQKHFWGDMNQLLSGKLDAIEAYDIFYMRDVLNENLGQRLEGFEVLISGIFTYQNRLDKNKRTRDDETVDQRNTRINKNLQTRMQLQWYKNLNLNHQLSFVTLNYVDFPLEKESSTEWFLSSQASFNWLWTITDRYLLTTSLGNRFEKPQYKSRFPDIDRYLNRLNLSGNLSYFIENKMSISGGAAFGFDTNSNNSSSREEIRHSLTWSINASIRYYFGRNLF